MPPILSTFLDVQLSRMELIPQLRCAGDFEEWQCQLQFVHTIIMTDSTSQAEKDNGLRKLTLIGLSSLKRDTIIKDKVTEMIAKFCGKSLLSYEQMVDFVREACKDE